MKLSFENNGTRLQLETPKQFDMATGTAFLALASKVLTGDEQANHVLTATLDDQNQEHRINYADVPGWREPVKAKVMCPFCGESYTREIPYGYKHIRCRVCHNKIHVSAAAGEYGVPDEKGFYYVAEEPERDDSMMDKELLDEMQKNDLTDEPKQD